MKPSTQIIGHMLRLGNKELYERFKASGAYNEVRSEARRLMGIPESRAEYKTFIVYRLFLNAAVRAKNCDHELEEYAKKAIGDLLESIALPRNSFVKVTSTEIVIYEHLT